MKYYYNNMLSHRAKYHGFFLCMLIALAARSGAQVPAQSVSMPVTIQPLGSIIGDKFENVAGTGISIQTNPTIAKVFIDDIERGQTPFTDSTLHGGQYNIRLTKDGYSDRAFTVTLSGTSRLLVEIEMQTATGQVLLNIQRAPGSPPSLPLEPIIEGIDIDSTTEPITLPVGYQTIRVRAFGWEENSQIVNVLDDAVTIVNMIMQPAVFRLSNGTTGRRVFNPNNPGALGRAEFYFEVSAPGTGVLHVQDSNGDEVYSAPLEPFSAWVQTAAWNGCDTAGNHLPQGQYTIIIQGEPVAKNGAPADAELTLQVQIDYSLVIYPLTFTVGIPGLLFAPSAAAFPVGSFQVEAGIFMGNFAKPFQVPFHAGLRIVPLSKFELAAAFNVTPGSERNTGFGFSASAKYAFFHGETIPLDIAACIGWNFAPAQAADNTAATLFVGRGGSVHIPLALNFGDTATISCTALLSPGMRWPGADDLPRLLLPVGFFVKGNWFLAGLSFRTEFDFTDASVPIDQRIHLAGGAELKLYPAPSNVIYTISGGVWHHNEKTGGFGGLSIGFLY